MTTKKEWYAIGRKALATGEASQWQAAEAMAKLLDDGDSQNTIAKGMGCDQKTVSRYVAVWRQAVGLTPRPSFSEAMSQVRGDRTTEYVPVTPEKRAELVAKLLNDKAIADAPIVREVQARHTDRRLRQEAAEFNAEYDIPTRTETAREGRLVSTAQNDLFWQQTTMTMRGATRAVNDAHSEIERTGLPRSNSGDLIKEARALGRAAKRLEESATEAALGNAMSD